MEKPTLYIVQGFLGAGKSTFADKLAQENGAIKLDPDAWCLENYTPIELEKDWNGCFAAAVDLLWQKTEFFLNNNKNVIFDMGFWTLSSREFARHIAEKTNSRFVHYYVYAPDNILIERLKLRKGSIAENNLRDFYKIKVLFQEPTAAENAIKIDNF